MGYVILPFAVLLFLLGVSAQLGQQAQALPGAGLAGQADQLAGIAAQSAQRFAAACVTTAAASPGLIATSIAVTTSIPGGATVAAPAGAGCMTTSAGGTTRNVLAFMSVPSGAAAQVLRESGASASWYRVTTAGQAVNLLTGAAWGVPSSIQVGALVDWVQVTP